MTVSVCMATYLGEKFVASQIESILPQLSQGDELVIVDDASADRTLEVLRSYRDPRIRIIRHDVNLGVLRSFEDALTVARGEIIFYSDQDDVWAPDKVRIVTKIFEQNPKVDVIVSDADLIDENGAPIRGSYYAQRGEFHKGVLSNIVRCKFLGCTMAFRSRIRERVLPFPAGAHVLHDIWTGVCNEFTGGETLFVPHRLVSYRRHRENVTGNGRLPRSQQLRNRWDLCRELAKRWWKLRTTPRASGSTR